MLHLSKETVRNHVRNILRELRAHSRLEAVARAHELGLLTS
jgi:DNA-binding NarL/FixJ family response regulator